MNILNRLKKLETPGGDSTVCECYPNSAEVFLQTFDENGEANPLKRSREEPVPEFCEECNKPTDADKIIIEFTHQKINKKPPPL
jgi:hypothetical protein